MATGQLDQAEAFARQAQQLPVPDAAFAPNDDRPGLVLLDIRQARLRRAGAASRDYAVTQATGEVPAGPVANPAVYDSGNDPTHNMNVAAQQAVPCATGGAGRCQRTT